MPKRNRNVRTQANGMPWLKVRKLGIISRDYRYQFPNGSRDFSHAIRSIFKTLDGHGCDAIVFSLYSITPRRGVSIRRALAGLRSVRAVFLEEFSEGEKRRSLRNLVYYRTDTGWRSVAYKQQFKSLRQLDKKVIHQFVTEEVPERRLMGGTAILICGETNGVKYSKTRKRIEDTFGLARAIPSDVRLIVNPIHDRMTRFEMAMKRQYLSKGRWLVSVWNKGRVDAAGRVKDGQHPAWDVYCDGRRCNEEVHKIASFPAIEIGILELEE